MMSQDHFNLIQNVQQKMTRLRGLSNLFNPEGRYDVEHHRSGLLLAKYHIDNDIVNQGKNMIFNVMFNGSTPSTTWYIGLIDNAGFTALAAGDVLNSHAGWAENTGYSQSNRVTWGSGGASSQTITNGTPAQFDMTGTYTIYGIFIADNNTKGGTSGNLWSTGGFSATVPVVNGDQLKITYTLSA